MKSKARQVVELLLVGLALCAVLVFFSAMIAEAMAHVAEANDTARTNEWLERRVWDLELQLRQYQDANGLIVVRDDGECARQMWHNGGGEYCGTGWARFRIPDGNGLATVQYGQPEVASE